ncbi:DNA alkylation repair protein [Epibacterium sp. MM17-32]|uniref:DNA alkylation repair protein n=1 Tax=Epibacterium sp. MM17-32 TaxID=2917734 RepID=UPI001EF72719|nr:DNA alkylation repair protein [Epibacterium sp. MM17-32]MCG7629506.1 DNA alkylation repair protein [Epibacterium sp. MM17-32]
MTPDAALDALRAQVEPGRADQMIAYHKQSRTVLGVGNEVLNTLSRDWRGQLDIEARVDLAAGLWASDIFEARILAAKLLTQARIKPDTAVWDLVQTWVPDFDSWAIADHAASAISKRLQADPARLDVVEAWTTSDHMWSRRAALVSTLPWAKLSNPKPADLATRARILGWAATYVQDRDWFIQKAIGWWLRDLSKHDADRTRAFLAEHGDQMKAFARKEAARYLT